METKSLSEFVQEYISCDACLGELKITKEWVDMAPDGTAGSVEFDTCCTNCGHEEHYSVLLPIHCD